MKLIYYHLFKAISKIDMDKQTEWKALSVLSVFLFFNIISILNFMFVDEAIFLDLGSNKFYWLLFVLIIYGVLYKLYGSKEKSSELIDYYSSNTRFDSFLAKSITITYIIVTFTLLYFSTRV